MKSIAIMQPYIFAYIGYFQLINSVDQFIVYDDVNYIKNGWINRNTILINGEKKYINIAVEGASPNKLINELYLNDNFKKFNKSISLAYSRAPYFEDVNPMLNEIYSFDNKNLSKFIGNSIKQILDYLDIEKEVLYSSTLKKDNNLRGQEKVIAICKEQNATRYINAIGGQELYDREAFADENLQLKFIQTKIEPYKQFKNDFIGGLSIIDILMFNSKTEIKKMLELYELF